MSATKATSFARLNKHGDLANRISKHLSIVIHHKLMTTSEDFTSELFRNAILLQLESAAPASLTVPAIRQGVRLLGHRNDTASVLRELEYLTDKGLATPMDHPISKRTRRFRITAAGRDYLESEGLA
jgi:hypothetical protein